MQFQGYRILQNEGGYEGLQIFRAVEELSNRHVQIRAFPTVLSRFPLLLEKLQSTYDKLAQVHTKNFLPMIGVNTRTSHPFSVYPYVEAGSLGDRFRSGFFTALDISNIINEIAVSLEQAHRQGLVHGNLTPDHVLIDEVGSVHIIGFGEAAILRALPSTMPQGVIGFERAAPPEADNASKLSPATDQYSLALIALRLFTGLPTDEALEALKHDIAEIQMHKGREIQLTLSLSSHVLEALNRALAEKPSKRYPSISEFKHALLAGYGIVEQPQVTHVRQPEGILREEKPKQKKRSFALAPVLTLILVFGIAVTVVVAKWIDSDVPIVPHETNIVGTQSVIKLPDENSEDIGQYENTGLTRDPISLDASPTPAVDENGKSSPTPTAGGTGGQSGSTSVPQPTRTPALYPTVTDSLSGTETSTPDQSETPVISETPTPSVTPTPTITGPTDTPQPSNTPSLPPPTNTSPPPNPTVDPSKCNYNNDKSPHYCTPTP